MKYVLLGNLSPEWASKQSERIDKAKAKLDKLGIKLESINYTQGHYDFVDIVDAPNQGAARVLGLVRDPGYGADSKHAGLRRKDLRNRDQGRSGLAPATGSQLWWPSPGLILPGSVDGRKPERRPRIGRDH